MQPPQLYRHCLIPMKRAVMWCLLRLSPKSQVLSLSDCCHESVCLSKLFVAVSQLLATYLSHTLKHRPLQNRLQCCYQLPLLQASRNGSDLWLSYWVSKSLPEKLRQSSSSSTSQAVQPALSPLVTAAMPSSIPLWHLADWWREESTNVTAEQRRRLLHPTYFAFTGHGIHEDVSFFLSMLLLFAAGNSIFTLIRSTVPNMEGSLASTALLRAL